MLLMYALENVTSLLCYTINKNQIQQVKLFSKINYINELFIYLDLMTIQSLLSMQLTLEKIGYKSMIQNLSNQNSL